jgi:hypothetical protein
MLCSRRSHAANHHMRAIARDLSELIVPQHSHHLSPNHSITFSFTLTTSIAPLLTQSPTHFPKYGAAQRRQSHDSPPSRQTAIHRVQTRQEGSCWPSQYQNHLHRSRLGRTLCRRRGDSTRIQLQILETITGHRRYRRMRGKQLDDRCKKCEKPCRRLIFGGQTGYLGLRRTLDRRQMEELRAFFRSAQDWYICLEHFDL